MALSGGFGAANPERRTMPAALPRHLRPRREKIFGEPTWSPLDRNAKARIMAYAEDWNAKNRQPRQHRGPITRAMMDVLKALLWGFHNSKTGRCFPSYEAIAEKAGCCRDTVYEAIRVFERADILTWINRIARARVQELDLFGRLALRWKIIRTSNAYLFRDPLPCDDGQASSSMSENHTGTLNQELITSKAEVIHSLPRMSEALEAALARLGNSMADRIEQDAALSAA